MNQAACPKFRLQKASKVCIGNSGNIAGNNRKHTETCRNNGNSVSSLNRRKLLTARTSAAVPGTVSGSRTSFTLWHTAFQSHRFHFVSILFPFCFHHVHSSATFCIFFLDLPCLAFIVKASDSDNETSLLIIPPILWACAVKSLGELRPRQNHPQFSLVDVIAAKYARCSACNLVTDERSPKVLSVSCTRQRSSTTTWAAFPLISWSWLTKASARHQAGSGELLH